MAGGSSRRRPVLPAALAAGTACVVLGRAGAAFVVARQPAGAAPAGPGLQRVADAGAASPAATHDAGDLASAWRLGCVALLCASGASRTALRSSLGTAEIVVQEDEQSPAYMALQEAGLITTRYRIQSAAELDLIRGNRVSVGSNALRRTLAYLGGLFIGGIVYDRVFKQFSVKAGHVRPAQHVDGSYFFYGPGVHRVPGLFISIEEEKSLLELDAKIEHGTRTIVTALGRI